ncbi:High osmolarity signaling protein SHO1 [Zancudomyces culisetae]|uniref:High osmolarity signaling protein SHO1 n=1 Tax=Zancudomyces culisetae TaxID=1213189 RepID=A0A1R1PS38_ZANCU|nr:High osmolarity signaling protein SHO1 [Zancudomyces culisetae]|eukprot:OMH83777.1 High osmolarity signaling protein SHO1 [Zancudomyces culisetae]
MNQFDAGGILFRAVALYSYAPTDDPSELGFEKGEMLDILDDRGKWWSAKKSDGKSGIVPSNYVSLYFLRYIEFVWNQIWLSQF